MWVRGAAIRPVPKYARLRRASLDAAAARVEAAQNTGTLIKHLTQFEHAQPALAKEVNRLLDRPLDETSKAAGLFMCASVWLAFSEVFGDDLECVSKEALKATEESIRVEEDLRREHAEEPLDLEDIVMIEQPDIIAWVHEYVDAATDASRALAEEPEQETEVDVDDLHLVYRLTLTLALALSYAVAAPQKTETEHEILA
jgi:hypothetical protein